MCQGASVVSEWRVSRVDIPSRVVIGPNQGSIIGGKHPGVEVNVLKVVVALHVAHHVKEAHHQCETIDAVAHKFLVGE